MSHTNEAASKLYGAFLRNVGKYIYRLIYYKVEEDEVGGREEDRV
jgi:hypothetical protein